MGDTCPAEGEFFVTLKTGAAVTLRSICPADEPLMVKFHQTLSDYTVYMRYFCSLPLRTRVAHDRLVGVCFVDHVRQIAIIAELKDPVSGEVKILAVGRLMRLHSPDEAELALLVADAYQNQGLGTNLVGRLLAIASEKGIRRISAEMLGENIAVQAILKKAGFQISRTPDSTSVAATLGA